MHYDHLSIETKWREFWQSRNVYRTLDSVDTDKPKYYVLDMFPYPSGAGLHVGHPRGYIASDVFARFKRMNGFNVLHPMGFDSFGLPAEQYAIKTGNHPGPYTDELVEHYKQQLSGIGFSYDWSREVSTHRPEYYKWTQWIFLQLFNAWYNPATNKTEKIETCIEMLRITDANWDSYTDLERQDILMNYRIAYQGYAEVNWCPELGTVLANDEIVTAADGSMVSERGEYPVVRKSMRQWFMRISSYADRLLSGLDGIDWPESIKSIQRNWIGRSEGAEIDFKLSTGDVATVFTTRADTLFGVTYVVLAPEHELVQKLQSQITNWSDVSEYISKVKATSEDDRVNDKNEKTGICLQGISAINPANGEAVPVWVANYVLASYGTGAVMAVPAHDERDFEFAKKYNLEIVKVINFDISGLPMAAEPSSRYPGLTGQDNFVIEVDCFTGNGGLINSGEFTGFDSEKARALITEKYGRPITKFRMRDAIFARQRYWGEPIPLQHTQDGLIVPIDESQLPLVLPELDDFAPAGNGQSPLAKSTEWMAAGYETNTMPGWAGSSWYFLRYMDPTNGNAFASNDAVDYWRDVDMYVGGAEHATGHLLYARFWHKALHDLGYVPTDEPFRALRNQGMIAGTDGRKMSKRWGNVINPDDVVAQLGADTLRVYESFMGPFEAHLPWSTDGIVGSRRFIERVYKLAMSDKVSDAMTDKDTLVSLHKAIKKVTEDINSFSFNTAISAMMIAMNDFEKATTINKNDFARFLQILAPFAPFITEDLWHKIHGDDADSIHLAPWPTYDPELLIADTVTIGVQINGKVRAEITITPDADQTTAMSAAMELEAVQKWVTGEPKKVVYVTGKILNIII